MSFGGVAFAINLQSETSSKVQCNKAAALSVAERAAVQLHSCSCRFVRFVSAVFHAVSPAVSPNAVYSSPVGLFNLHFHNSNNNNSIKTSMKHKIYKGNRHISN